MAIQLNKIDKTEAARILGEMRTECFRNYDAYSNQVEMRPSERAMTLSHYERKIAALQYALKLINEQKR